jgi:hypothetical protein
MDKKILKELSELNDRLAEDRMYEIAVAEIENNEFDKVAQAIAFEEAEGDEKKARAFYSKHRVRRIKDEISYFAAELAATIEAEAKKEDQRILSLQKRNKKAQSEKRKGGFLAIIDFFLRTILFFIVFGTAFLIGSIGLVKFGLLDEIFPILLLITSLFVAYKVVMKMIP